MLSKSAEARKREFHHPEKEIMLRMKSYCRRAAENYISEFAHKRPLLWYNVANHQTEEP